MRFELMTLRKIGPQDQHNNQVAMVGIPQIGIYVYIRIYQPINPRVPKFTSLCLNTSPNAKVFRKVLPHLVFFNEGRSINNSSAPLLNSIRRHHLEMSVVKYHSLAYHFPTHEFLRNPSNAICKELHYFQASPYFVKLGAFKIKMRSDSFLIVNFDGRSGFDFVFKYDINNDSFLQGSVVLGGWQ